jgi:hypothetical protein
VDTRASGESGSDDPEEVLVATTAGPLAVDGPADLIVLGSDPLIRLEALGDLRVVVRAGRVVSR